MATVKIDFKGMDSVLKTINRIGTNAHNAIDKALLDCHELVTKQVDQEMTRYKSHTGQMKESIYRDEKVQWYGETARIFAGFDQKKSMHATYMMITGTPYRAPDRKLYNAIYGAKTKKAIKEITENALKQVIEGAVKWNKS